MRRRTSSRAYNALGASGIFRRVHVEKGIDRLIRPVGDGDTMPRGPDLDLAHVLFDERLAQIFALAGCPP